MPEVNLLKWPETSLAMQTHYFPISDILSEEDLETIRKNGIVKAKLTAQYEDGNWEGNFLMQGVENDGGLLQLTLYDGTEAFVLAPTDDTPTLYWCTDFKMLSSTETDIYSLGTRISQLRDGMNTSALANVGIESALFLDILVSNYKSLRFADNARCQIVSISIDSTSNGTIDFIYDRQYYRLSHQNGNLMLRVQEFVTFEPLAG